MADADRDLSDHFGRTALMQACGQWYLDADVNKDPVDTPRRTALLRVSENRHIDSVRLLEGRREEGPSGSSRPHSSTRGI